MASISTWYNSQYGNWNRTRRLSTAPYLARANTNTSRTATAMMRNNLNAADTDAAATAGAVVIDMGDLSDPANRDRDKKRQETLFGPNIGVVTSGPAWTETSEKSMPSSQLADQLTPEVVKGWITKSKESSQPTTTLQALVNLKRPTLRLSPLALAPTDDPAHKDSQDHHGLEFEYDCDADKCGIYVSVLVDDAGDGEMKKVLVFETVVEGGFGKVLRLDEGATLELGRFERHYASTSHLVEDPSTVDKSATDSTSRPGPSTTGATAQPSSTDDTNAPTRKSRRFTTTFNFRKRHIHAPSRSIAGPALAVVDADPVPAPSTAKADEGIKEGKEAGDEGVKVVIRLVALDKEGEELNSRNEQGTYLHVVRLGPTPAAKEETAGEKGTLGEDGRPWVVKVVKREATIGPHTFHLHEIYGLSAQSSAPAAPTSPSALPTAGDAKDKTSDVDKDAENADGETHTYPPPPSATLPSPSLPIHSHAQHPSTEEDPSSECLLCLSSPREVVLLPCRHLVACRDCALNMVEFGAGGSIVVPEEPVPGAASGNADGGEGGEGSGGTTVLMAANTNQDRRRKRKAKGWFCPVCRQPYTSLLRITTTPPLAEANKDKDATPQEGGAKEKERQLDGANSNRASTSTTGSEAYADAEESVPNSAPTATDAPLPATTSNNSAATEPPKAGGLAGLRPAFLRGISRGSANNAGTPDLERGDGAGPGGAS